MDAVHGQTRILFVFLQRRLQSLAGLGRKVHALNHWIRGWHWTIIVLPELVFGWSFYRQGKAAVGTIRCDDEFLMRGSHWFLESRSRLGTAWEKARERLAKLAAHRRTLLVLDGLEPLQTKSPGPQEDAYVKLPFRSFCANSLPLIRDFP